jgi:hypothetical protein
VIGDARSAIARLKAHRLAREAKIAAAMRGCPRARQRTGCRSPTTTCRERMWPVAARSLTAHVDAHPAHAAAHGMTTTHGEGLPPGQARGALAGCSRREAELLIENGAVRVEGQLGAGCRRRACARTKRVEIEPGARRMPVRRSRCCCTSRPARLRRSAPPAGGGNHHEAERAGLRFVPRHVQGSTA